MFLLGPFHDMLQLLLLLFGFFKDIVLFDYNFIRVALSKEVLPNPHAMEGKQLFFFVLAIAKIKIVNFFILQDLSALFWAPEATVG
jgi:hypothetical protein